MRSSQPTSPSGRTLSGALEAALRLAGAGDGDADLAEPLRRIAELLDADRAVIVAVESGPGTDAPLLRQVAAAPPGEAAPPKTSEPSPAFPPDWWAALAAGEVVTGRSGRLRAAGRTLLGMEGDRAMLIAPVGSDDGSRGILAIRSAREPRRWTARDRGTVGILAPFLAIALRRIADEQRRRARSERDDRLFANLSEAQRMARVGSWERAFRPEPRVLWSEEIYRMYGFALDEPAPTFDALLARIHPEDREKLACAFAGAVERLEPFEIEYRVALPDGTEKVVLARGVPHAGADGKPDRIAGVSMDVTEIRQAQEERDLRAMLLASTSDSVFAIDPDGRIVFVNEAAWKSRGYTRDELLAMDIRTLDAPDYSARVGERIRDLLERGEAIFESAHLRKDGSVMPVEVSSRVVEIGGRRMFVSVIRDVTERKRVEAELARIDEQLRDRVRLLERRNAQISLLAEMARVFQACRKVEEAWDVAGRFSERIFPGLCGSFLAIHETAKPMQVVAAWGECPPENVPTTPESCWALRLERAYATGGEEKNLPCDHFEHPHPGRALCVPLRARGEPFGVLRIGTTGGDGAPEHLADAGEGLAETIAEQVSLALANLRLHDMLREQAIHDPLTGLFNRRYLEEALDKELRRAARREGRVGLLMLDLDHFKLYNDSFGHAAGDAVLRLVGEFLRSRVRAEDTVCRYGGEEFVVVMPDVGEAEMLARAEELRHGIGFLHPAEVEQVTISIGAALFPAAGETPVALLRAADVALYQAKALGRNRVESFAAG